MTPSQPVDGRKWTASDYLMLVQIALTLSLFWLIPAMLAA